MAELMEKLKPYVSTFSAALPFQFQHGDIVKVGGVVTSILDMMDILKDASNTDNTKEGIYVTLDDEVGENKLVIAQKAYEAFVKQYGQIKLGDILLAEGCFFRLDTTHTYEGLRGKKVTIDNHQSETLRVLAYHIIPLPEEEPKKVKQIQPE